MKKNINISPVGLKGDAINERMKQLMGVKSVIKENTSNIVVELTKMGPDGKSYAIIRENHEWYIKVTSKTSSILAEDFQYIGGLMNKKSEAYPSYAKAIKQLNLKFKSLAEAYNVSSDINIFENDNLISEEDDEDYEKASREVEYGVKPEVDDLAALRAGKHMKNEGIGGSKIEKIMSMIGSVDSKMDNGKKPKVWIDNENKNCLNLSAEDGQYFADYYGEIDGSGFPYIDPRLEAIADKFDSYWEWDNPSVITLCLDGLNEIQQTVQDTEDDIEMTEAEKAVDEIIAREELKGGQKKLDVNKNGKLDSDDFEKLRDGQKDDVNESKITFSNTLKNIDNLLNNKKKN
jgi:hypothetical protein